MLARSEVLVVLSWGWSPAKIPRGATSAHHNRTRVLGFFVAIGIEVECVRAGETSKALSTY
jgi:hypothetical protein